MNTSVWALLAWVLVFVSLGAQGCTGCYYAYRRDSHSSLPYYKVEVCPGKSPVVLCSSPTRLSEDSTGTCR